MVFKHDESKNEYWRKFIIVAVMRDCKKPETVILKAEGDIKWATEGYSSSLSLAGSLVEHRSVYHMKTYMDAKLVWSQCYKK